MACNHFSYSRYFSVRRIHYAEEEGSQVVSHTLVQVLVVAVILALLQLTYALYTRNLMISAAAESARRGALVGGNENDACMRAEKLTTDAVGKQPREIACNIVNFGDYKQVVVNIKTQLPVVAAWGPSGSLSVSGRSLLENEGTF